MFVGGYECITIKQLIEHLQQFPDDTPCVYACCSDYAALTSDYIKLHKAENKTMVYRNNGVKDVYPYTQWGDEKPQYISVVEFPGN